jgi:hypothetical protein
MIKKSVSQNHQVGWNIHGLKNKQMLSVYAYSVVQRICTCNVDFHMCHVTSIPFPCEWHIQVPPFPMAHQPLVGHGLLIIEAS